MKVDNFSYCIDNLIINRLQKIVDLMEKFVVSFFWGTILTQYLWYSRHSIYRKIKTEVSNAADSMWKYTKRKVKQLKKKGQTDPQNREHQQNDEQLDSNQDGAEHEADLKKQRKEKKIRKNLPKEQRYLRELTKRATLSQHFQEQDNSFYHKKYYSQQVGESRILGGTEIDESRMKQSKRDHHRRKRALNLRNITKNYEGWFLQNKSINTMSNQIDPTQQYSPSSFKRDPAQFYENVQNFQVDNIEDYYATQDPENYDENVLGYDPFEPSQNEEVINVSQF